MIDLAIIRDALGILIPDGMAFDDLGLVSMQHARRLITFLDRGEFINEALNNGNIAAAFVTPDLINALAGSSIYPILVDDPRWYYYTLHNHLAKMQAIDVPTQIDASAIVHSTAYISPKNVQIGRNCIIEPNVTILDGAEIDECCIVRAGAVLGISDLEVKRTSRGILEVEHDGKLVIGNRVLIGANTVVPKGFHFRHTIIGDDTKFGSLVHCAHGAQIGKRCIIAPLALIGGGVSIGDDVWIGASAAISNQVTIGSGASITIGSVVTKDVAIKQRVTGNFAIPHEIFLRRLKESLL